ncbi:hypothetical protein [Ralstonia sp. ASV6]|uniref:hypothetical protein n=1 Tax=Ralstonia sp. ASV6 TaxID=2795124 RepID=UPI0018EC94FC|nr:hypothetical protein [Ralstonia sp. ASV6]
MNPFACLDRAVEHPGWKGIAFRLTCCLVVMGATYWLRDWMLWLNANVLHSDSVVPSEAKHHGVVVVMTLVGAIWLALELIHAVRLLRRQYQHKKGSPE